MEEKVIECPVREEINAFCSCPKTDCKNHGLCCECIIEHKNRVDVPILIKFPHCLRDLVKEAMDESTEKGEEFFS